MTLDMESPLFIETKKLGSISPPSRQNSNTGNQQSNSRISFSITEILKPDFGTTGSEPRGQKSDKEAELSPVSPPPFTKDSCTKDSFAKDSLSKDTLQSYYQLYQQRYAQYMYGLQLPLNPQLKVTPPSVQPQPFIIPSPVSGLSGLNGLNGLYNPVNPQHIVHHPHYPVPSQLSPQQLHHHHHHQQQQQQQPLPQVHRHYPTQVSSPTQPQQPKRAPSPITPPPPPKKPVEHHHLGQRSSAPAPKPEPPRPKETSVSGDEGKESGDKDGEGNMMWPAWVYCTRYSDRPSAGPRSRKMKRREKQSTSADEKRPRTAFTNDQLDFLRKEFEENKYLTEERRQRLAKQLELTESQIKIWFQNKRAKLKKSTGNKNSLTMSLIAQGLYNHTPVSDDSSQMSDGKMDTVTSHS